MHILRKIIGIPIEAPLVLRALMLLYALPYVGVWYYMPLMHYVEFQCLCDASPGGIVSDTIVLLFNVIWLYGFTIVFIYSLRLARLKGFLPVFEKCRWRDLAIFILPIHTLIYRLGDFSGGTARRYSQAAMILWSGVTVCAIAALVSGWYYLFLPAVLLFPLDFWLVSRTLISAADLKWCTVWKWFVGCLAVAMIGVHMTLFGWTFVIDRRIDAGEQKLKETFGYSLTKEGVKAYYLKGLTPNYRQIFDKDDLDEELTPVIKGYDIELSKKEYELSRKWLMANQKKIATMDELIGQGYIKEDCPPDRIFRNSSRLTEHRIWLEINMIRLRMALYDKDQAAVIGVLRQYQELLKIAADGVSNDERIIAKRTIIERNWALERALAAGILNREFINELIVEIEAYRKSWLERYYHFKYLHMAESYNRNCRLQCLNEVLDDMLFFRSGIKHENCMDMKTLVGRLLSAPFYVETRSWGLDCYEEMNYVIEGLPKWRKYARQKSYERQDVDQLLPLVALKIELYRQEHGEIPETLEALVPEYMNTVPLDPMDGKRLRYQAGMIETLVEKIEAPEDEHDLGDAREASKKSKNEEDDFWSGIGKQDSDLIYYSRDMEDFWGSRPPKRTIVRLEGWRVYSIGWDLIDQNGQDWKRKQYDKEHDISFTVIGTNRR